MPAKSPPFLMWYDDNPKLSITHKIEDAIAAYADRLGVKPTLVLVNEEEITEHPGVAVRSATTVRRNTYWVGQEDRPGAAPIAAEPIPTKPAVRRAAQAKLTPPPRINPIKPAPVDPAPAVAAPPVAAPATPRRRAKAPA